MTEQIRVSWEHCWNQPQNYPLDNYHSLRFWFKSFESLDLLSFSSPCGWGVGMFWSFKTVVRALNSLSSLKLNVLARTCATLIAQLKRHSPTLNWIGGGCQQWGIFNWKILTFENYKIRDRDFSSPLSLSSLLSPLSILLPFLHSTLLVSGAKR